MSLIETIKESWGWTGICPEKIIGENDFGNQIIKDIRDQYWRLCPEEVYCEVIATNQSELDELSHKQEFLSDWYMVNLTELAKEKLGPLQFGRKYHLVIPGVLGGEYGISNIRTVLQSDQIRFAGDIGRQIKELPDGAQIQLKVID